MQQMAHLCCCFIRIHDAWAIFMPPCKKDWRSSLELKTISSRSGPMTDIINGTDAENCLFLFRCFYLTFISILTSNHFISKLAKVPSHMRNCRQWWYEHQFNLIWNSFASISYFFQVRNEFRSLENVSEHHTLHMQAPIVYPAWSLYYIISKSSSCKSQSSRLTYQRKPFVAHDCYTSLKSFHQTGSHQFCTHLSTIESLTTKTSKSPNFSAHTLPSTIGRSLDWN